MSATSKRLRCSLGRLGPGAVAGLFLACSCAAGGGQGTPSPSPAPTASGGPSVAEDLTFTGALSGRMAAGSAGDTYVCAASGGAFVAGPILGVVGGLQVEMNITKLSFQGPGSYTAGGVSFDVSADHYYPATGAAGTLVVAADLQSGTVDIGLAVNTDPNHVVAHVRGAWRCPPGGS